MRPGEADATAVLVGELEQTLAHPLRHVLEGVLRGVDEALPLDPLVVVVDVDELGAHARTRRVRARA